MEAVDSKKRLRTAISIGEYEIWSGNGTGNSHRLAKQINSLK
jgi:hypothetical protein